MKNSNLHEPPITRDTLLITYAESGVKHRVLILLLGFSMRQLHNELIASPNDEGLLGSTHANSDTMLCSLAPTQLLPMTEHHKMMCGCAICNNSKYFQESLNAWRRKKLTIMKYKADNSCGRKKMN